MLNGAKLVHFGNEEITPESTVVVIVPGLGGGDRESWVSALSDREEGTVVGFVSSVTPGMVKADPKLKSIEGIGGQIATELATVDCARLVLVGHSVGIFIAFVVASEMGARLDGIVAFNGGLSTVGRFIDSPLRTFRTRPKVCTAAMRLFALVGVPLPLQLRLFVSHHAPLYRLALGQLVGPAALSDQKIRESLFRGGGRPTALIALFLNRHHWRSFLANAHRVSASVTLVAGCLDPIAPVDDTYEVASLLPDARVVVAEGVHHAAQLEAPDMVKQAILEAL